MTTIAPKFTPIDTHKVRADQYTVTADRETGEWIGEPFFAGEVILKEWHKMQDTDAEHFDTYEHEGETRAIKVVWMA